MTWRRLDVLVQQAAADPESALWRDFADRPYLDIEAAVAAEHTLRVLAWQRSKDAQATPPKNYPLPLTARDEPATSEKPAISPAQLAEFRKRTQGGESLVS